MSRRRFFLLWMAALPALAGFKGAKLAARRGRAKRSERDAAAVSVVEFSVSADEPFPVRALDPVLYIGEVEVTDYRYADIENKTLIFTCYEPEKLGDDVPAWLQYGNDTRTHTDLGRFRLSMAR